MKSSDDKTENKPLHQKNVKHITQEERLERSQEDFERVVNRNCDAFTRLSKE